ncbi:uncharacterized protein LOC121389625 [Gigantopelta aegis]|uniref:uncharacterized protein LOC121389625 n=1 Tax=Gigantopelta aegis TaxID=1735272 RepID=UPI001B88BF4B|nr:uncharacterized protein LOC121389625 [Gigantopelta aegis]
MQCDVNSSVFSSAVAQQKLNDLEQYTRKNSVRIFEVNDKNRDETTEQTMEAAVGVLKKIGVDIKVGDINIAHRLGKFKEGSSRPMTVKFVSRIHKQKVLYNRRKLEGSGIGIAEDLTAKDLAYLQQLKEEKTVEAAWTRDTKFFVKLKSDGKIIKVYPTKYLHKYAYDSDIIYP